MKNKTKTILAGEKKDTMKHLSSPPCPCPGCRPVDCSPFVESQLHKGY